MTELYNRILERQIAKHLDAEKSKGLENFLEAVSKSYSHFDNDRILIERAMDLSSRELTDANQQLKDNSSKNDLIIKALKETVLALQPTHSPFSSSETNELNDALMLVEFVRTQAELRKKAEGDLILAKQKAEEANQSKSRFLANMSHEIRTPLNAILGFTEILLSHPKNDEQKDLLDIIHSSGDSLLKLLNDILDLAKIEQGRLELENLHFNLRDAMTSGLTPYRVKTNMKNLEFSISFDAALPEQVVGDPHRIRQAVVNLVGNALKFTSIGFIRVHFELAKPLTPGAKTFMLNIKVSDSGIGVKKEHHELIFQDFSQADEATNRLYGGTGLGLNIVKQLAGLMHGSISVESPNPRDKGLPGYDGSLFNFQVQLGLPAIEFLSEQEESARAKLQFDKKLKVLIAEDNYLNQKLIVSFLKSMNCDVTVAGDGAEALKYYSGEAQYDLILMDAQMPVMNGFEATMAIRRTGSKIPIIGVTANVFKDDIESCLRAGMNSHLGKPFSKRALYNAMVSCLS